jgi:hypothetical protein
MKIKFLTFSALVVILIIGCKKDGCHECHYDGPSGQIIELGEFCGDSLETIEANGYTDTSGVNHVVHCHGH